MKILIAEDEIITRRALEKNIEEWGYEVVLARNGEEAWTTINDNEIRLAILDWTMPKMDGIEVCQKIRQQCQVHNGKYVYIILLTGRDLQQDILTGLSAGADDYMTKPFDPLELKIRLQKGERIIRLEDSRLTQANTDSLTKQWNRNGIIERLEEEFARSRRDATCLSTIMLDIDNFKQINDIYGHPVGDEVLVQVACRLKRNIRRYDKLGRWGGDEFLAILPDCRLDKAKKIAERLRQAVGGKRIKTSEGLFQVSISLGCSTSLDPARVSAQNLIQRCDNALIIAKKKGRNRVEPDSALHDPKMKE